TTSDHIVFIVDDDERIRGITDRVNRGEWHTFSVARPASMCGLERALGVTRRVSKGSCSIDSLMELPSRSEGTSLIAGRLLPTRAPSPIARRFACQSSERRCECRL